MNEYEANAVYSSTAYNGFSPFLRDRVYSVIKRRPAECFVKAERCGSHRKSVGIFQGKSAS